MTEAELIAKQALRIAELEESLHDRDERLGKIHGMLICIGGPLNDNSLQFNAKQLILIRRIENQSSPDS